MTSWVIDPVSWNDADLVIEGASQGQHLDIKSPSLDFRVGEDSLCHLGAESFESALGIPNTRNGEKLYNEITNPSCPALIPGLGNRLFGVGSVFGISRSDYEVIAFVEKRLHLLKMRDISGIVGISEETYATGRPAHPLFDSMPFAAIHRTIDAGATRIVLGTAAYRDVDLLDAALAEYGDRVVVSVDVRDGMLAASGWTEQTELPVGPVIERLGARGVRRFVYSSIARDGMLEGPDLEGISTVAAAVRGTFVYSGGVASVDDLRALVELRQVNLGGVIVGKALYEQRFTVADAQAVLDARKDDD